MKATRTRRAVWGCLLLAIAMATGSCIEKASEAQIEGACQNLLKLQPGSGGEATERLNKCKQDLTTEGVSAQAAECRSKAADIDSFWNKCR